MRKPYVKVTICVVLLASAVTFQLIVKSVGQDKGGPLPNEIVRSLAIPFTKGTALAVVSQGERCLVHRFGSSPTKGHRVASASGSSHRQLHDEGYPPFLPFQPVFVPKTG